MLTARQKIMLRPCSFIATVLLLPPAAALFLPAPASSQVQLLPCSYSTPALLLPSSYPLFCFAQLYFCPLPAPALLLVFSCPAPAPTNPSLAAFIIISTLWLFSARREPPFMVPSEILICLLAIRIGFCGDIRARDLQNMSLCTSYRICIHREAWIYVARLNSRLSLICHCGGQKKWFNRFNRFSLSAVVISWIICLSNLQYCDFL